MSDEAKSQDPQPEKTPANLAEALAPVCDVCQGESGGTFLGVASLSSGPMSIAFCDKCAHEGAEPTFAMEHLFIFVAGGDLEKLHPAARELPTWADGRYMPLSEYVTRISPEDVERQLNEFALALGAVEE